MTAPADFAGFWSLDPQVAYLNHGSFGAGPLPVLDAQRRLRARMERHPARFLDRDLTPLLDAARDAVARFVHADAGGLVFVPNATTGVNTVLRSLRFEAGDEILTTDHEYNACRNALDFTARATGAALVVAPVPFPLASPGDASGAILARVTDRTRFVLVDHVTSPTALILPVEEIVAGLAGSRAELMIDGAHAPGMISLEVSSLGAAYYTGNCHKWLSAPKGAAFLWVRADRRDDIRPLTISHGWNDRRRDRSRFQLLFDWTGTDDPTAFLCAPEAIRFMGGLLPGGWPELMARNRGLALAARELLCRALGTPPPAPADMIGAMAALPLPDIPGLDLDPIHPDDPWQRRLLEDFGIEVPIFVWPSSPRRLIRISAQAYNRLEQYERLAAALADLAGGRSQAGGRP